MQQELLKSTQEEYILILPISEHGVRDPEDCNERLYDDDLGEDEENACTRLVELCQEIAASYEDHGRFHEEE